MAIFGNNVIGAVYLNGTTNEKVGVQYTAPENGLLTAITAYFYNDNAARCDGFVYADSGANAPAALLASQTMTLAAETTDWRTWTGFALPISAGTIYWLGINFGTMYVEFHYIQESTWRARWDASDTPPPDDPFGAGTNYTDVHGCVYATYTPTAAVTPAQHKFFPITRHMNQRTGRSRAWQYR